MSEEVPTGDLLDTAEVASPSMVSQSSAEFAKTVSGYMLSGGGIDDLLETKPPSQSGTNAEPLLQGETTEEEGNNNNDNTNNTSRDIGDEAATNEAAADDDNAKNKAAMAPCICCLSIAVAIQPWLLASKINAEAYARTNYNVVDYDPDSYSMYSWKWTVLFIPNWIVLLGHVIGYFGVAIALYLTSSNSTAERKAQPERAVILLPFAYLFWFIGFLGIAREFDDLDEEREEQVETGNFVEMSTDWHKLFIPLYVAIGLHIVESVYTVYISRKRKEGLMAEEDQVNIMILDEIIYKQSDSSCRWTFMYLPLMYLIVSKLGGTTTTTWWYVFSPFWIYACLYVAGQFSYVCLFDRKHLQDVSRDSMGNTTDDDNVVVDPIDEQRKTAAKTRMGYVLHEICNCVLVAVIVGKLNADWQDANYVVELDSDGDGEMGYSAYWILFTPAICAISMICFACCCALACGIKK